MERTHFGQHGDGCFGCKIQSVQMSPSAMPTRTRSNVPPRRPNNNWEKGILTDGRGMAVRRGGKPIGLKEYADNRTTIDRELRALKQGHDPVPALKG